MAKSNRESFHADKWLTVGLSFRFLFLDISDRSTVGPMECSAMKSRRADEETE